MRDITTPKFDSAAALEESVLKVKIGRIKYSNVLPFFHRLGETVPSQTSKPPVQFHFTDECPSKINELMAAGEVDMAPVSSLFYFSHPETYLLLPNLAISARDFSGSVLLFSKDKIETLDQQKIAVTEESLSSATLLQIILKFKYRFVNQFTSCPSDPDKMLERYRAALVIGDQALFYQPKNFVYKYDLSELWWNWTGKPFCFALWVVRKSFAQDYPAEVSWICEQIAKTREKNLADIEQLLKEALDLQFTSEQFTKLFGYLFNLNYGLESRVLEGLELFYRLAERLGLGIRPKNLEFFNTQ